MQVRQMTRRRRRLTQNNARITRESSLVKARTQLRLRAHVADNEHLGSSRPKNRQKTGSVKFGDVALFNANARPGSGFSSQTGPSRDTPVAHFAGTRIFPPTLRFYERECQEKIVLRRAEGARELVSAFSPCHALCQWVVTKYLGICSDPRPDHTHFSPLAAWLWPTSGKRL